MSEVRDFMIYATSDAKQQGAGDNPTWVITFTGGENRAGKLRLLGSHAYVLSSENKNNYYFSSSQVVRLHLHPTQ